MSQGDPRGDDAMLALHARFPDDPVLSLHARRIAEGRALAPLAA